MFKNDKHVYGDGEVFVPATLNFAEFLIGKFWTHRQKICWINAATGQSYTFGELLQQSLNIAVSLSRLGLKKGEVVGICSENKIEFWPSLIGSICVGAVATTFNIGYTEGEFTHVANISKPKFMFCSPLFYKTHEKTLKSFPFVKRIIVFGEEKFPKTLQYGNLAFPGRGFVEKDVAYENFLVADVNGQTDTLFILYSSGTTGLPKGVMMTHLNLLTVCNSIPATTNELLGFTIPPWFHAMGLNDNLTAFVSGRTALYMEKFDLKLFIDGIVKYKVQVLTVAPPVLVALSKYNSDHDFSSLVCVYSGAAPISKELMELLIKKFPNTLFLQGYGLSECSLAATRNTPENAHTAKLGSVGKVIAGSIVKVVDLETGKTLGPNERGEICIKSPTIMKGYVGKDPNQDIDEEGFLKTGDIGYYDDDKEFFIVDRLKELIKYKGYQVPPAEIEALLLQHDAVQDVAVVGVPHAAGGEAPLAFVVRREGARLSEEEVKSYVAERLSNPKHLRGGVRFLDQIPKNPSGKILRRELKKMLKKTKSKL